MSIKNALVRNSSMWMCDALEARLQSAEEKRGRLVAAVMSTMGGQDGE
jgi:hypothetical protein